MAYLKLSGEVGIDITLYNVVGAIQDLRKAGEITELNVDITSYGGDSEEGRQIYDMLKSLEFPVYTNGVEYVCSAGLTIFCAGQKRTAQDNNVEWLMHSPKFAPDFFDAMFGLSEQELDYLKKTVSEEKQLLAKIYSEALNIDIETIKTLMDKDEMISTETAKSIGIIQEIKETASTDLQPFNYKVAAKWYANKQEKQLIIKSEKMANEKLEEKVTGLEKIVNSIKAGIDKLTGNIKALTLNTDEGDTLELSGDVLEVGVSVVSGEDGTYTVNYNDMKYTVVVAGGIVESMTEVVEEDTDEMEALKQENESLKTQLAELTAKAEKVEELEANAKDYEQLEAKYGELETLVKGLESITSEYKKEDGTYEFSTGKKVVEPSAKEKIMAHIEAKKQEKLNKGKNK